MSSDPPPSDMVMRRTEGKHRGVCSEESVHMEAPLSARMLQNMGQNGGKASVSINLSSVTMRHYR